MDEVARSIRVSSTQKRQSDATIGHFFGGFVAGEGWFGVTRRLPPYGDGAPRLRFVFAVAIASRDRAILDELHEFLGFGSIREQRPRNPAHLPISTLTVASIRAHQAATIPFGERYLPSSQKRNQFEQWRDKLQHHLVRRRPREERSTCSMLGCDKFVRGRGLCRSHYYRATGY